MSYLTEGLFGVLLGHAGAWTLRLLTLGRYKPDPESWEALWIGLMVLLAILIGAAICG